jgi:hypothetical protein
MRSTDRDAWIRVTAAEYRRAIAGRENFHRGGGPRGCLEWLNNGRPSSTDLTASTAHRRGARVEQERPRTGRTYEIEGAE